MTLTGAEVVFVHASFEITLIANAVPVAGEPADAVRPLAAMLDIL